LCSNILIVGCARDTKKGAAGGKIVRTTARKDYRLRCWFVCKKRQGGFEKNQGGKVDDAAEGDRGAIDGAANSEGTKTGTANKERQYRPYSVLSKSASQRDRGKE